MNRRDFLQLLGAGLPAAVVCEKVGLLERVRTYFFAPQVGWVPPLLPNVTTSYCVALQLEKGRHLISTLYENDCVLYKLMNVDVHTKRAHFREPILYKDIEWDKAITL